MEYCNREERILVLVGVDSFPLSGTASGNHAGAEISKPKIGKPKHNCGNNADPRGRPSK